MDPVFWIKRWQERRTGWHSDEINPNLKRYWNQLHLEPETTVFVPLCGKSKDLKWLADRGHTVIGIEISEIAVREFFQEMEVTPESDEIEKLTRYSYKNIRVWQGDFFDLDPGNVPKPDAIYDRAALIALPPGMRGDYINHLISFCEPHTQLLLVTFEYNRDEMDGPPFAVPEAEVKQLFGDHFRIQLLQRHSILETRPKFREAGLTSLEEKVYHIFPDRK